MSAVLPKRFILYPGKRSQGFYRVFVFPTRRAMWAFWSYQCGGDGENVGRLGWEALTSSWTQFRLRNGKFERGHCLGQVLFHAGQIGGGTISHELTHAALYFLKRKSDDWPMSLSKRDDERLAHTVGVLTRQFWSRFWGMKLDRWVKLHERRARR